MTFEEFNKLSKTDAEKLLLSCCGSQRWVSNMIDKMPFKDEHAVIKQAGDVWYNACNEADWMEAFTHHPKIGDVKSLATKFADTKHLAENEQSAVNEADEETLSGLVSANREYEAKFGFIFIVFATGKSAREMLQLIRSRMKNGLKGELKVAMGEQHKITVLRLQKIISKAKWNTMQSQITTHVLDTSAGHPGRNMNVKLMQYSDDTWEAIAQGITDKDGRVSNLLPSERTLKSGKYKMVFDTGSYFGAQKVTGFYPEVEIQFLVTDDKHYHVPLLINPFGYSTYRGS